VTGFDPDNLELPIHTIKYGGSSMGNASAADSAEHLEIKRCESAVQADFFSSDGERNSNDNMMEPKSAVIRPEGTLTTPS